jgi:hypothetical protein
VNTLKTTHLIDIYSGMVAGSFPLGERVDPEHSVSLIAQDVLSTTVVHMLTSVEAGSVYYLAVPSKLLASAPEFATPLAAALPGHPDHKGDGAYVYSFLPHAAAVLRRGATLKLLVSFATEVREAIAAEDLPTIEVSEGSGQILRSESWLYRSLTTKAARITTMASLAVIAASGILFLGSNVVAGYLSAGQATRAQALATEANAVIENTQLTQPLAKQVQRLSAISAAVVTTGGWIDGYQYAKASGERFAISLPGWVTQDVIKELGDGVHTELQTSDNLVWAVKKDSTGQGIKGQGPAEITVAADHRPAAKQPQAAKAPQTGETK